MDPFKNGLFTAAYGEWVDFLDEGEMLCPYPFGTAERREWRDGFANGKRLRDEFNQRVQSCLEASKIPQIDDCL